MKPSPGYPGSGTPRAFLSIGVQHPGMTLDVEVPDPPELSNRGVPAEFEAVEAVGSSADLRREELEAFLADGAWREGFEEWAQYTDLGEAEFAAARELGLFRAFDFYWDPSDALLRFEAPSVPDDWRRRLDRDALDVTLVGAELQDLGRAVAETLVESYVDRGEGGDGETGYAWGGETFGYDTREEE